MVLQKNRLIAKQRKEGEVLVKFSSSQLSKSSRWYLLSTRYQVSNGIQTSDLCGSSHGSHSGGMLHRTKQTFPEEIPTLYLAVMNLILLPVFVTVSRGRSVVIEERKIRKTKLSRPISVDAIGPYTSPSLCHERI